MLRRRSGFSFSFSGTYEQKRLFRAPRSMPFVSPPIGASVSLGVLFLVNNGSISYLNSTEHTLCLRDVNVYYHGDFWFSSPLKEPIMLSPGRMCTLGAGKFRQSLEHVPALPTETKKEALL